mmetsp:Transcript_6890/g.17882  ORF Transcript_6890/g.17882 Transcript_6890/m.17882 type:complete len:147 (-) Transcript_6890:563-1003(-)
MVAMHQQHLNSETLRSALCTLRRRAIGMKAVPRLRRHRLGRACWDASPMIYSRTPVAADHNDLTSLVTIVAYLAFTAIAILAEGSILVQPPQMFELANGCILQEYAQLVWVYATTICTRLITSFGSTVLMLSIVVARAMVSTYVLH